MSGQFQIINGELLNLDVVAGINPYFVPAGQGGQQNPMRNPRAIVRVTLLASSVAGYVPYPGAPLPGVIDITQPADIAYVRRQCLSLIDAGECRWFTAPVANFGMTTMTAGGGGGSTAGTGTQAPPGQAPPVKRTLSPAARKKMSLAQKARHAKAQAGTGTGDGADPSGETAPPAPTGKKKTRAAAGKTHAATA